MVSNQDLIRAVFDDDIYKMNKWFFRADWEKAEISQLESKKQLLEIKDIIWEGGIWENGAWYDGIWKNGILKGGFWYNGIWEKGTWENGYWYGGTWKKGTWKNGYWHNGTWKRGTWENGKIWNHEKNRYIESTFPPNECKWSSSYGK